MREYLRPYYGRLIFMIVAALLSVSAEITIPLLTKTVVDSAIRHANRTLLIELGLAAVAFGLFQVFLNFFRRWIQSYAVAGMEKTMREDLYAHLQRLDTGFHDSWQSGQLLSRATTDLSAIRRFGGFGVVFFITNIWTFLVVVAILIHLNWWLGLLTGAVFVPVFLLCLAFEKRYRVLSRRVQDEQGDLATYIEEAATGIRVLKALGRRREAEARHREQADQVFGTMLSMARLRGSFWAGLDLVPNIVIGLILLLGALAVSRHELSVGGLVAFITLALLLVWPIEAMGYIIAGGQEAATAAQRVYEIFDTPPAITNKPGVTEVRALVPAQAEAPAARPGVGRGFGHLVFDEVTFTYPQAPAPVLRGVSLDLAPGETVALVGATGSGKTTLLQLVPRLADVTTGAIRLDGTDVRDLPLGVLRARLGCAFEDPTLFSASVRENVSYGMPDASEDDINAALAVAQADFVPDLPWGLDTRIGEQGMALSGGQRQRIALARAILGRPHVLLLDDPLSALDVHTEAKVTRALGEVLTMSTALIVAHRPSTVLLADRVALLSHGVISAVGTHRQLLATQPAYRDLMSAEPDLTSGALR
ncbi:MAG TPA: ABC transporter ATP-binding protein [Streptosporangiaceae bacterium]|nr:ABC transporter ATP-binding protein [Streptosporangiaceae bacterium]